jgi:predicted SprT family Zn-dependent metalloprotease
MKNCSLLERLPKYFDVGWAKFEFKLKSKLREGGDDCYGVTDFNLNTITLDKGMSDKVAHPTILHEVCHALMETQGLGGSEHDKDGSLLSTNEVVTEACCRAMLIFRNLNPELWDLLFNNYYEREN